MKFSDAVDGIDLDGVKLENFELNLGEYILNNDLLSGWMSTFSTEYQAGPDFDLDNHLNHLIEEVRCLQFMDCSLGRSLTCLCDLVMLGKKSTM